jgi:hypothetical protein
VQQIAEKTAGKALDRVRHERNMLLSHKRYKRSLNNADREENAGPPWAGKEVGPAMFAASRPVAFTA